MKNAIKQKGHIYVVTHKQVDICENNGFVPIAVGGADLHYQNGLSDNSGENISNKNPNYCELTALYWIWKNRLDEEYSGLCHYRRYFYRTIFHQKPMTYDMCQSYMKHYDVILPYPKAWIGQTVAGWYIYDEGRQSELDLLREVVLEKYPEYLESYDETMNSYEAFYYNMFFMPTNLLNNYCSWLFDILFEVEKRINLDGYTKKQARIFGYLSERLFNVWINYNKKSVRVKFFPVFMTGVDRSIVDNCKEVAKHFLVKYFIKGRKHEV